MAVENHVAIFKKGPKAWNNWRGKFPDLKPDLSDINFECDVHEYKSLYDMPMFDDYNLTSVNLNRIQARNSSFTNCLFDYSDLYASDLCFSHFDNCSFVDAIPISATTPDDLTPHQAKPLFSLH